MTERQNGKQRPGRPKSRPKGNWMKSRVKRANLAKLDQAIALTPDPDDPERPMTDRRFAADVLGIHERTLRKYRAGQPIPAVVLRLLDRIIADHEGNSPVRSVKT
jgi:hypothetical protein